MNETHKHALSTGEFFFIMLALGIIVGGGERHEIAVRNVA
jgi:hypothetical protein